MTPKEKAQELFDKFYPFRSSDANALMHYNAKQCALIVVEEIMPWADDHSSVSVKYWNEVKQEIEKL